MRKIICYFLMILTSLFIWQASLAGPDINKYTGKTAGKAGFDTNVSATTISETVGKVIKVVLSLTATVFLALTVYAGILWLTAGGNDERVTKANKILYTGVIGLIIVMSAYGITTFVIWAVFGAAGDKTCSWGPGTC